MLQRAIGVVLVFSSFLSQPRAQGDSERYESMIEMYRGYRNKAFEKAPEITVDQYLALADTAKVALVDVREKREREVSTIPGAISREEFVKNRSRYRGHVIVAYCTIGYRSGEFVEKIGKKTNAYNLIGGVLAWAHAGRTFVINDTATVAVHVYGKKWDLAPVRYATTW